MKNKNNLALIAILYNNHSANLYSDIYFPIINYGIATISKNQHDTEKYYDIEVLQFTIEQDFGIKIPLIVLKQALRALVSKQQDITIKLYEKGEKFQIIKEWDVYIDKSIEERLSSVTKDFDELEQAFREFIEKSDITTDKSFIDFFTENTEDIFKYLDHLEAVPSINENYYHIAKFLIQIKEKNSSIFILANNIFWASIISAFLKRDVDLNIKPEAKVYYYLDSSLVMAILDLDSELNTIYGLELLSAIVASGHIPCIHPLTIKEIDSILFSVEKFGPNHGSAIESAYYRRNLNPIGILKIRSSLPELLKNAKIQSLENYSKNQLEEICEKYKNRPIVNSLKETRGYSNGSIRDIHDIFMCDFIIKKRGNVQNIEKANSSFVSLNSDLITFVKQKFSEKISPIIHPANIISDLWLHDPKCTLVKENGLTEMMSRCIALNNTDVRRKLRQLAKFIDTDSLTESDYIAVYNSLINRSQVVLKKFDSIQNSEIDNEETTRSIVADIIQVSKVEEENRIKHLESIQNQNEVIAVQNKVLIEEIESFKRTIADNIKSQSVITRQNIDKDSEIEKLKHQQKQILKLNNRSKEIESLLQPLEIKKKNSVSMMKFRFLLILEIFAVCLFALSIVLYIYNTDFLQKNFLLVFTTSSGLISIATFAIALLIFSVKIKDSVLLSYRIKYDSNKEEQIEHWLSKNKEYELLLNEKKEIDLKLKSFEEE